MPLPTPHRLRRDDAQASSVHDYARRMAFLTELDSQTWISRYSAAERLGDPETVTSVARYLAWLRRTGAAWNAVLMPTVEQAEAVWPFTALPASGIDAAGQIEADLRDLARAGGGPHRGPGGRHVGASAAVAPPAVPTQHEDVDAAFITAAAYVAVTLAQEVAVLAADVEHLSDTASHTPLPQRYVRHSGHIASMRGPLRRELAGWADQAGPEASERVVLAARMLTDQLAEALISATRPGW